jgi:hypothetical protein
MNIYNPIESDFNTQNLYDMNNYFRFKFKYKYYQNH